MDIYNLIKLILDISNQIYNLYCILHQLEIEGKKDSIQFNNTVYNIGLCEELEESYYEKISKYKYDDILETLQLFKTLNNKKQIDRIKNKIDIVFDNDEKQGSPRNSIITDFFQMLGINSNVICIDPTNMLPQNNTTDYLLENKLKEMFKIIEFIYIVLLQEKIDDKKYYNIRNIFINEKYAYMFESGINISSFKDHVYVEKINDPTLSLSLKNSIIKLFESLQNNYSHKESTIIACNIKAHIHLLNNVDFNWAKKITKHYVSDVEICNEIIDYIENLKQKQLSND